MGSNQVLEKARPFGFALIAITAVAAWFLLAPSAAYDGVWSVSQTDTRIGWDSALTNLRTTKFETTWAEETTFVQQWANNEYLGQIAAVLEDMGTQKPDERTPALIGLAVLALAWFGITGPVYRSSRSPDAPEPT